VARARRLPRSFSARSSPAVAPELLNKVLVVGACRGRIVEVEAYTGADDPASHAYRGRTPRNATMFGPAGHLYVYFTYGMHHCANVVTAVDGVAEAVLLRGVEPLAGLDEMQARRPVARRPSQLADGPGKLCAAFGLDRAHDGIDLVRGEVARIEDDGVAPPADPVTTSRIGISRAVERPWRWLVAPAERG
jgi:DNA-3-methyladenine glycosylase